MLIENKYVVRETRDNLYFTGMNSENFPVLESLNSRVRTYKSEKAAKMAINCIGAVEYCDFIVEFIKSEEVPDVPKDKPPEPPKMVPVYDDSEWEEVLVCAVPPRKPGDAATLSKIALCRRQTGGREIFGVKTADSSLYSAGFGEGETALRRFLEEYYKYLLPRVTRERRWGYGVSQMR